MRIRLRRRADSVQASMQIPEESESRNKKGIFNLLTKSDKLNCNKPTLWEKTNTLAFVDSLPPLRLQNIAVVLTKLRSTDCETHHELSPQPPRRNPAFSSTLSQTLASSLPFQSPELAANCRVLGSSQPRIALASSTCLHSYNERWPVASSRLLASCFSRTEKESKRNEKKRKASNLRF